MIHITGSKVLENCLDNSIVKEIQLSDPIGETLMRRIARYGKLQYFPDFPRPYFRIDRNRAYIVQGVLGNTSIRVTFSPLADQDAEKQLQTLIETPLPDEK